MHTVLLVVHLMIAVALVGVVLLQKSEGGALGIGGGGGGFLTGRGQANLLTRVTAGLALAFFTTSILLSILGRPVAPSGSVLDKVTTPAPASSTATPPSTTAPASDSASPSATAPATPGAPSDAPAQPRGGILDKLQ